MVDVRSLLSIVARNYYSKEGEVGRASHWGAHSQKGQRLSSSCQHQVNPRPGPFSDSQHTQAPGNLACLVSHVSLVSFIQPAKVQYLASPNDRSTHFSLLRLSAGEQT